VFLDHLPRGELCPNLSVFGVFMGFDTSRFVNLMQQRLAGKTQELREQFNKSSAQVGTRFLIIDDFLPEDIAHQIHLAFQPKSSAWREMSSFREKKLTSKKYDDFDKILGEVTFAIQEKVIVDLFAEITGIKQQVGDPGLYAGGLSMMRAGDFLNPHIDNSHELDRKLYRRLNLLYYVSPGWTLEDGGNLELWETSVRKNVTIESKFNRLVLMETDKTSWHSVSAVKKTDAFRCCVSNYYFSPESPTGVDYFHITEFKGRPDEPFKRLWSDVDSLIRTAVRKIKKSGIGKKDIYKGAG
jgi:Rps23 Pro-64 3,4-dihydroxylase Tpa1-like proline 4-hydroxylase